MKVRYNEKKFETIQDKTLYTKLKDEFTYINSLLQTNNEYLVYGILIRDAFTYFYICEEDQNYPVPYNSVFFDLIENYVPNDWKIKIKYLENKVITLISFKEMVDNNVFYENLVNGSKKEIEIFNEYKNAYSYQSKHDSIYQNLNIKKIAEKLNDNWVLCPECNEAWKVNKYIGVIKCPNKNCNLKLNNPYAPILTSQ